MNELQERLFDAIKKGPLTAVSECLNQGAKVNYSHFSRTPLKEACKENKFEAVSLFLKFPELNINFGEPEDSAILSALGRDKKGSHKKIVDLLFYDPRLSQEGNNHALLYYAKIGDLEKIKECLSTRGCVANYHHESDGNALTNATTSGSVNVIEYLLLLPGININDTNFYEEPPITIAIRKGFLDIANLFLNRSDLDLHVQSGLSGTPLTAALFYGLVEGRLQSAESERAKLSERLYELAGRLLQKESQFIDKEHPGALKCVIRADRTDFLQLLLSKGADVNGKCGEEGYEETIDVHDTGYASPYGGVRLPDFDLPIVAALQNNSCKVIPVLLEAGADVDKKGDNNDGKGKSARELLIDNTEPNESRRIIQEWINAQEQKQKAPHQKQEAPVGYGALYPSANSTTIHSVKATAIRTEASKISTNGAPIDTNNSTHSPG